MANEVLMQMKCLNSLIEPHPVEVDECVEHSLALLPERGHINTSYTSLSRKTLEEMYTQHRSASRDQRCSYAGLTGSLRIEPGREYSHPKEVKAREEEEQQRTVHQVTKRVPGLTRFKLTPRTVANKELIQPNFLLLLLLALLLRLGVTLARRRLANSQHRDNPHEYRPYLHTLHDRNAVLLALIIESIEGGLPAYGQGGSLLSGRELITAHTGQCRQGLIKSRGNIMTFKPKIFPHGDLHPLPQRAIRGLPDGSSFTLDGELFHTVHIWEFPLIYVILKHKMWLHLSKLLRGSPNLAALARRLKLGRGILANIRDNPDQSIGIPNLKKLCREFDLDPSEIERSLRTVQFNQSGKPEKITFPFVMDIYSWRILCHITGDGNVSDRKDRPNPYLRWTQLHEKNEAKIKDIPPKNQRFMRALLERLSRLSGGSSDSVSYPKVLTYATMGTIPGLTVSDLRSPTFIQYIIDLPLSYRDYKIQFLAAFAIDDSGIDQAINFFQSSKLVLEKVIELCQQLNYENSSDPYLHIRDNVWSFRLLLRGVRKFYNDIIDIQSRYATDPVLGLWHKQQNHKKIVDNISDKRLEDNQRATNVHVTIITILSDNIVRDSKKLRNHPKLHPLVKNYSNKIFLDRLRLLHKFNLIREVKKPNNHSYRPKHWVIPPGRDLKTLLKEFHSKYGDRSHPQSYKRTNVTRTMVKKIIVQLVAEGFEPSPTNVARRGGFSRKVIYKRADLRDLFKDYMNDDHDKEE